MTTRFAKQGPSDFVKERWIAVVLAILGILAGAVIYSRTLEMRILELDVEVHLLESEKRALENDLNKATEENRTLREQIRDLERKLGLKPSEQQTGAAPPRGLSISIPVVPTKGQGPQSEGSISGQVVGLTKPETYKIVLYARTDRWYVQPYTAQPLTDIDAAGRWKNSTHLGREYAALLVRPNYSPPSAPEQLPPIGGDVLAIARVPATS